MRFKNMRIFFLLTGAVTFLNLQQLSAEDCPTSPKCLQTNLKPAKPLEVGFLFDVVNGQNADPTQRLLDIICQVIKEFGNALSIRLLPGATVPVTNDGIKCKDECWDVRVVACQGFVDEKMFTQCYPPGVPQQAVADCMDKKSSDPILKENSALRCKLGIPTNNIPAVILDKSYVICEDITSAKQLKSILCTSYGKNLKGC